MPVSRDLGASPPSVTILSSRRLLAESIRSALVALAQMDADHCVVIESIGGPPPMKSDILVVDLDDAGASKGELERFVNDHSWSRRIGVFDHFDARRAALAFELGCVALCPFDSSVDHLIATITGGVESSSTRAVGVTAAELQRLGLLSPREVEVLRHLVDGTSATDIAAALGITVHTVETHKRRAYAKLDVQSTARAVALALAGGISRITAEPLVYAEAAASPTHRRRTV